MKRIYVTHCSRSKDDKFQFTNATTTPDVLYTSSKTQAFTRECKTKRVQWAIFSDKYGIWFPSEKHGWYEKDPNTVTESEFKQLLRDFDAKLAVYDEIWFYHNPGRFHHLYKRLLDLSTLYSKIHLFTRVAEIK